MKNTQTSFLGYRILSILSLIGAGISIWQTRLYYLTRSGMGEMNAFCNIGQTFDCTAIEMSPWSEFVAGGPLSAFAIAAYLLIFGMSILSFFEDYRAGLRRILLLLTGIAVLFSAFYLYIMLAKIGKLCVLCLGIDALNLAMLAIAYYLPHEKHETHFHHVKTGSVLAAVSLLAAFLFAKGVNPTAQIKDEDVRDLVESVIATPPVSFQIPETAASIGPKDAKITIVKFSDYQCPACRMAAQSLHPLMKRYPNQVRFVFMNFPLDSSCNPNIQRRLHEAACESAKLAICANQKGVFSSAYETLFEHQTDLAPGKVLEILGKGKGISTEGLSACAESLSTIDQLKGEMKLAVDLKVQSTPTFYVNGKKIEGGLPTMVWMQVIDRILAGR